MGKTVALVVAAVATVAIAIAAPYLVGATAAFWASIGVSTAVATAIVSATLTLGVGLAFRALGVGAVPTAKAAIGPPQMFRQTITESFIVYGKRRVGGLIVFHHSRKLGSDHFRYFVIAVAGHRCKGVVSFMLNDAIVTVDAGTGEVTSGDYAGGAWLWFDRGETPATANAVFVAECGGKWTAAHRGNDVAKIYAKFQMTDEVIQANMPNITAIIEGKDDILDPRDGSVGYTRNAALIFYDWMKLPREEGGFGAYADETPDDAWISAQANVCDEVVGGEPRYALDAVITTGAAPSEVRDALAVNQAGTYTYSNGKHLMRPGYWVPPSATLREEDLAGPIQVSAFMPADAAANEVHGNFINPADNYQGAPFAAQTITPAPTDIKQVDLDLAFTTSRRQAQRVASIMLKRAQCEKTVVWPMNLAGIKRRAMETVLLAETRYGLSNYAFVIDAWNFAADFTTVLTLREENEEIYDEPAFVAPGAVPTIARGETVLPTSTIAGLIDSSWAINPTPLTPMVSATETTITIKDHQRRYDDKIVSVSGGGYLKTEDGLPLLTEAGELIGVGDGSPSFIGLTPGKIYHIGYEDPDRAGGTVNYQISETLTDVSNSGTGGPSPFMHYFATISTAAAGSGGTNSGTGATPPGYTGGVNP